MGNEAKGVRNHQGWARRLRDLDVRGGAAEGTAPWPCVGVYWRSISPQLR